MESQDYPAQLRVHHQYRYFLAMASIGLALAVLLYLVSRANYPLFHSIADMLTVFIAGSVFLVVWNGRRHLDNNYYLLISIAFLAFALLDFMHLVGNKGMGIFPQYGNLGPTFYIASRYVLGVSFLLAPLFIKRKVYPVLVLAAYMLGVALVLLSVLLWRNFPTTYIDGTGLTAFKVYSDYVVCLMLLGGLGLLLLNRHAFDARILRIIALSLVFSIATGLVFTLYTDPFGIMNGVGHFFQIASFYLIYLGFVETVLTTPQNILYRNLRQSNDSVLKLNSELESLNLSLSNDIAARKRAEEALRASEAKFRNLFENIEEMVTVYEVQRDESGRIVELRLREANPAFLRILGVSSVDDIHGKTSSEIFGRTWSEQHLPAIQKAMDTGQLQVQEVYRPESGRHYITTVLRLDAGTYLGTGWDITDRKRAEEQLRKRAEELAKANAELETFNKAMVGRELRMVELKKEVDKFCRQSGQPTRYGYDAE
ncbi:MAG: hypothetical protein A2X45_17975 [Lentisphaerae bacterium GWF2_50_93]|nr:MAG: hypothetical protein A2X45_17975 [Lentisphaerae bacterium GWF2_50_93]